MVVTLLKALFFVRVLSSFQEIQQRCILFGTSSVSLAADSFPSRVPRLYIERIEDVREFLGENFSSVDLFSAINAVNDKYHLVKVSRVDEFILRFTHCLKEDRYLNFKADLPEYIRELDDALESFKMGCRIIQESNDEPMKDYIDRMMDADDDMYKVKRTQS